MAASQPLQDVATLMVETGARPEEICRLRHENINPSKRVFICAVR